VLLLVFEFGVGGAEVDAEAGGGAGDAHAGWLVAVGAVAGRELDVAGAGVGGVVVLVGGTDGDCFRAEAEDAVRDVLAEVARAGVVVGGVVVEGYRVGVARCDDFGGRLGVGG